MNFVIDQIKNGDEFEEIVPDGTDPIEFAERRWDSLSEFDKEKRECFYVCTAELNENNCADLDTAKVLKEFK